MSTAKNVSAVKEIDIERINRDSEILVYTLAKAWSKQLLVNAVIEAESKVVRLENELDILKISDEYRFKMIKLLEKRVTELEKQSWHIKKQGDEQTLC